MTTFQIARGAAIVVSVRKVCKSESYPLSLCGNTKINKNIWQLNPTPKLKKLLA